MARSNSMSNYTVLRRRDIVTPTMDNMSAASTRHTDFMRAGRADLGASFDIAPSITVETGEMTPKEVVDIRRDREVIAIAPSMPLELIKPTETKVLSDAEAHSIASSTWGVKAVRADESPYDGEGIIVAVLDTGIDPNHPAFKGVELQRRNFTSEGDDDENGHGTHCAGTIFGQDIVFGQNIGELRIGIARGVKKALIGKVLGKGGSTPETIANAITWAIENQANIISMSLGIDFLGYINRLVSEDYSVREASSIALEGYRANINLFSEIASYAQQRNVLIVAASGNESRRKPRLPRPSYKISVAPPAAGTGVVAVGALEEISADDKLDVANFSNNQVNIAAPGVDVISAWPSSIGILASLSGTSMAAPHVAGAAALWAQRYRQQTGRVVYNALLAQLIASGTRAPLAANAGNDADDVGTGIVQAPLN
jgi:subtilisin family serine protease